MPVAQRIECYPLARQNFALVVQRIGRELPELAIEVRFLSRALSTHVNFDPL